jgi:Icc protein
MTLIAHLTDFHLRPRGLTCYRVSDTNMLAERAIKAVLSLESRPDAVIITGDLTDRDDPREYALARQILGRMPMPVYVIPGNHDTTEGMRTALSDYPGIRESKGPDLCYAADIGNVRLIALDSSVPEKPHGYIGPEQLAWLDKTLAESDRPTLIAVHHPPAQTGIVHMDRIGLSDTAELAEVIGKHPHVTRLICGHVHRPVFAEFAGTIMTLAPSVAHQVVLDFDDEAPAMFNFEPAAYFLHHYKPASGLVTHMAYVENHPGPFHFWSDEGVTWPGDEAE